MSESDGPKAAEPTMEEGRRSWRDRLSIVWAVPILALLVSLGVVWRTYADRGPLIEVAFEDASGIRAEETQLRYRDVVVGVVEAVRFSEDLGQVLVEIRVDKEVGPYVDAGARFWVVRPEVSAQGVSGLDTVLGGVYLMGSWDGVVGEPERHFDGLRSSPLVTNDEPGIRFTLRSTSVAGLSENAPILYRGLDVGKVGNLRLADDGVSVLADAFVRQPEARLVTSATRFWDTSGFDFSFGASGAQLSVNSLASLVTGGVAFETTVSGGEPLPDNPVFRLYSDEESARASVFDTTSDGEPVNFTVIFEDLVPGLEVGADVEFGGIIVGRVSGLTGVLDEETFGDRGVRLLTTIELQPGKMGLDPDATQADVLDFMQFAVRNGLRAQLTSASLLGGLQVALVQLERPGQRGDRGRGSALSPNPLGSRRPYRLRRYRGGGLQPDQQPSRRGTSQQRDRGHAEREPAPERRRRHGNPLRGAGSHRGRAPLRQFRGHPDHPGAGRGHHVLAPRHRRPAAGRGDAAERGRRGAGARRRARGRGGSRRLRSTKPWRTARRPWPTSIPPSSS